MSQGNLDKKPSQPTNFVTSGQVDLIKKVEKEINLLLKDVNRKATINRNWDLGLTLGSICLTLGITISGVLGEEVVGKNRSKVLAGILGAGLVAIQSTSRSIPIKQRSGGYRVLEAQLINLEFESIFMQSNDGKLDNTEINLIISKLSDLRKEAARLEQDLSQK
ncbi:hypothetical protein IQ260_26715 [Leptolyngbya cf. ectocarpi LEGE 11479]|uniref:Uncharacterized protein n=1 Tax=Leptolyngbya cf. ectocarpi LEGE 11479 TaxID=1828722 RepID=A0A929FCQ2_LEPEC|nr:hypothetical protein [Leptolyngbya ectocarpi]MBE9070239.1 hypothetical protein [Leptolyngbya cf. ectocarpi LEGE 11479]